MPARPLVVLVTCPTRRHARTLADALVRKRLAACVNLLPHPVESVYRWQGKIERAKEILLLMKTHASQFERLRTEIRILHPYDVPEIIALPITAGHAPYLQWIADSLRALHT